MYNLLFSQKCYNMRNFLIQVIKFGEAKIEIQNGKIIQELVEENNLFMFKDGTGTHIAQNGNKPVLI